MFRKIIFTIFDLCYLIIISIVLIPVLIKLKEIKLFFKKFQKKPVEPTIESKDKESNPIDEYQRIQIDIDRHDEKIEKDITNSLIFDYPKFEKFINSDEPKNYKNIDFWYIEDKGFSEFNLIKKIIKPDTKEINIKVGHSSSSSDPEFLKKSFQIKLNYKSMSSDDIKQIVLKYYYCYRLIYKKKEREEQIAKSAAIYDVLKQSQRDSLLSTLLDK